MFLWLGKSYLISSKPNCLQMKTIVTVAAKTSWNRRFLLAKDLHFVFHVDSPPFPENKKNVGKKDEHAKRPLMHFSNHNPISSLPQYIITFYKGGGERVQ